MQLKEAESFTMPVPRSYPGYHEVITRVGARGGVWGLKVKLEVKLWNERGWRVGGWEVHGRAQGRPWVMRLVARRVASPTEHAQAVLSPC